MRVRIWATPKIRKLYMLYTRMRVHAFLFAPFAFSLADKSCQSFRAFRLFVQFIHEGKNYGFVKISVREIAVFSRTYITYLTLIAVSWKR